MYNVSIRLYAVLLVAASMAGFVSCGNSKSEEQLKAEALLSDAQSMFDSNQYDKSIALIDSLSKTYPGLIEVQRNAMHLKTLATEKKTILDSISNDSVIIANKQLVDSLSKGFKYVKTQDMCILEYSSICNNNASIKNCVYFDLDYRRFSLSKFPFEEVLIDYNRLFLKTVVRILRSNFVETGFIKCSFLRIPKIRLLIHICMLPVRLN